MIYKNNNDILVVDGKAYAPGDVVVCNEYDDLYRGLRGVITEIRTGEDKETENEFPDIYVDFEKPESYAEQKEVEKRFSEGFGEEKTFAEDDICLDGIIEAPNMIDVQDENTIKELFIVRTMIGVETKGKTSTETLKYFSNHGDAEKNFFRQIAISKDEYKDWYKDGVYESFEPDLYCAQDGIRENYVQVSLEYSNISINQAEKRELYHEYERDCHIEDVMSKLDEVNKTLHDIILEQIDSIVDDFEGILNKNDGYYGAYWGTVDTAIINALKDEE